jgi:hypothetical protein
MLVVERPEVLADAALLITDGLAASSCRARHPDWSTPSRGAMKKRIFRRARGALVFRDLRNNAERE